MKPSNKVLANTLKSRLDVALHQINECRRGIREWKDSSPEIADIYVFACEMWWQEARNLRKRLLDHVRCHG